MMDVRNDDNPSSSFKIDLKYLMRALIKYGASDLHLKAGRPPLFRMNGKLVPAKMELLAPEKVQEILFNVLSQKQLEELEKNRQIDFSFRVKELGRFRANVFYQRGALGAAIRMIPNVIPSLEELGIPSVLQDLSQRPRGLLLITGATGSGKSTTMASLVQYINENRYVHILMVEDPIEYLYRDQRASITQREIGSDVCSFDDALYGGLRQDPDIIVIGELRSASVIQTALTAAETGRLVISTLHTNDARSTIERIIDVCPPEAKNEVRIQLASTLVGIVSQQLIPKLDGTGRIPACEILVKSPLIEKHILKNELSKVSDAIASSSDYYRMQSMNQDLERLVRAGSIHSDEAFRASPSPEDLKLRISGIGREEGYQNAKAS